jgi:FkbM family methyltransferase
MQAQQTLPGQPAVQELQLQLATQQVQILRTRQAVSAIQAEIALQRQGRTPRFGGIEFTAQYGEDFIAWQLLDGQLDGFFIEAGAFDGYHYSVTYAFESIGWDGLLVEAIPDAAAKCAQRRPHSRVARAALSRRGSPNWAPFHLLQDQYGGMLSYLHPTEPHVAESAWAPRTIIDVPVTTLADLLVGHDRPIDLAVIDVEGTELDVLDGLDLPRFRPRLMFIEENSQGRNPALMNYMASHGYTLAARVMVNDIYVRNDQSDMLDRAKWLRMG